MTLTQIKPAGLSKPVDLADNEKIRLGTGYDLQIYHSGTESWIKDIGTGSLYLGADRVVLQNAAVDETTAMFSQNGSADLYYDNSKKLETTASGISVSGSVAADGLAIGDSELATFGSSADLVISHGGTDSHITNNTGQLKIAGDAIRITNAAVSETQALFTADGAVELYHNNVKKLETTADGATINGVTVSTGNIQINNDTAKIRLGASQDLEIFHGGSQSEINSLTGGLAIKDTGGFMRIRSNELKIQSTANENYIECDANGAVQLFYDNSNKFETTNYGNHFNGNLRCDDGSYIQLGSGQDFQLSHNGTNSFITNSTGELQFQANDVRFYTSGASETHAKFIHNGSVELYWNNSKRFWTTDHGGYLMDDDSSVELRLMTSGETPRGYLYANDNNEVGILDEGGNWAIRHHNDTITEFRIANGVKASITTHGGIAFGTDTAAANTLDDYEEGSWTPTLEHSGSTYTFSHQTGKYVKIGRLVNIQFFVYGYRSGGSSTIRLSSLPFTIREGDMTQLLSQDIGLASYPSNFTYLSGYGMNNQTKFVLFYRTTSGSAANLQYNSWSTSSSSPSYIYGNATYYTDS